MKVFQQLVVVVFSVVVFNPAFAGDGYNDVVITVSVEPVTSDEDTDVYVDQLITEADQGLVQGGVPDELAGSIEDDDNSYLYMKVWSEGLEPVVNIQSGIGTQKSEGYSPP